MRDSLTFLAILLIAVLTTALVGPYLIDWNAHRASIEARLSALAGTRVTVGGPIDLKLLPKPVMRLGSVAIGEKAGPYGTIPGASAAGPSLTADAVDAELSLPALLRGQVQVVDATLRGPHLDLAQGSDGAILLPHLSPSEADHVAIEHVGIRNGSVVVRLADGRRVELDGIDLDGEATTLRGPFKARGSVGGLPLRFATGTLDGGRMRVKLGIDPAEGRPALDLDGTLALTTAPFSFDGALSAAGAVPLQGTPATIPWRVGAKAKADPSGVRLSDVEIRAGNDLRALIADGSGTIVRRATPDAAPEIALKLHGAGLDLDGLAVAPKDGGIAPPQGTEVLGLLVGAMGDRVEDAALPVRLAADLDLDTATLGGRTLLGATLHVDLGPEAGAKIAVSAKGPDGAKLALDGLLAPGPAFRGRADLAAPDLNRLAAWLKPVAPDAAAWLVAVVPARALAAAGELDAARGRIAMRAATLRLDGSRFAGSLSYEQASASGRPGLTADLMTDRLDLGSLPDLGGSISPGTDLDLALAAPVVELSGAAASAAGGPLAGGPLAFHVRRTGDDVDLDRFSLSFAGASVVASGSRAGGQAHAEMRFDAPAAAPVAAIVARLAPGPLSAALVAHAGALSPASGTISLEAAAAAGGTLAPSRLTLDGTIGGTRLAATLRPDVDTEGADASSRPLALSVDASAPDAAVPLRALGVAAAGGVIGVFDAHASARGSLAAGFTVAANAKLGATALSYDGRTEVGHRRGRLTLSTVDLRPLLAGIGTLPVSAGAGAIPADAGADLDWTDARSALGGIAAHVAGASVTGDLTLGSGPSGGSGSQVSGKLSGQLSFDRLPASALLALGLGTSAEAVTGAASSADDVWSSAPFGAAPVLPMGEIKLKIGHMPLRGDVEASDAALTLRATRTGISLADGSARLGGGSVGGRIDIQRDGPSATLSARFTSHDIGIDLGDLSGRAGGDLRLAGVGASPAALVRSLGGTGTLDLAAATLARMDPEAPARVATAFTPKDPLADPDPNGLDAAAIGKRLSDELDRGPLRFGRQADALLVAGGVLKFAPLKASDGGSSATTDAALDLGDLALSLRTHLVPVRADPSGAAPSGIGDVSVTETGPIGSSPTRQVDAAGLIGQLQAQAVARAQERIETFEQDLRERAYFNRQLKAIQADQAAARQRAAAEMAAAKASADARQAELVREKADEARVQAQFEAAARAEAAKAEAARVAAEAEVERRRFIERQVQGVGGTGIDPARSIAPTDRRRHVRPHDAPDLITPPSIVDESPRATGRP